jgi:hypothetical protein
MGHGIIDKGIHTGFTALNLDGTFLRRDGTWAVPPAPALVNPTGFTQDLGVGRSGEFDLIGSFTGLTTGGLYLVFHTANTATLKLGRDEIEFTPVIMTGRGLNSTDMRIYWATAQRDVWVGNLTFSVFTFI